jgi:hypothetical protein
VRVCERVGACVLARVCVWGCPIAWACAYAGSRLVLLIQHATRMRHIVVICGFSGSTTFFRHYFINDAIFGETLLSMNFVFWFSLQLLCKAFLILRRIPRDSVINVKTSSYKVAIFLLSLLKVEFSRRIFKKNQISNFIKIRPVGVELLQTNGRTWRI